VAQPLHITCKSRHDLAGSGIVIVGKAQVLKSLVEAIAQVIDDPLAEVLARHLTEVVEDTPEEGYRQKSQGNIGQFIIVLPLDDSINQELAQHWPDHTR